MAANEVSSQDSGFPSLRKRIVSCQKLPGTSPTFAQCHCPLAQAACVSGGGGSWQSRSSGIR